MERSKVYSIESLLSSQLENYSREKLIALLAAYTRLYMVLDGHWYLSVKERFGDEEAVNIDLQVWDKQIWKEIGVLAKLMNLQNRDVVSLMELSVIMPSSAGSKGYMEIKNRNDCIFSITYCPILNTLEKEGKGREKTQCEVICRRLMTNMAIAFNPDIEVKPIKMPPRQNQDDVYCQWQFKLKGVQ